MNAYSDPDQKAIARKIRMLVPDATAIIFHGARVHGLPSPTSDYDILVLTPTGVASDDRRLVKKQLEETFPDVKLDVVFGSERYLLASMAFEPYPRFWLENGIAVFGQIPDAKPYPRIYRSSLDSRLDVIRAEVEVVQIASRTLYQKGRGFMRILKDLALIENALQGDYRNESLWTKVEQLVGSPTFQILPDPVQRHRIRQPMVNRLHRLVLRKISSLRKENMRSAQATSRYPIAR